MQLPVWYKTLPLPPTPPKKYAHIYFSFNTCKLFLLSKKVFTLADRKSRVWKLISIYFYILSSPIENYQNYYIVKCKNYNHKKVIYRKTKKQGKKIWNFF